MHITIKLNTRYTLQIINVYAPTSTTEDEIVEKMYEDISDAKRREKAHSEHIGKLS